MVKSVADATGKKLIQIKRIYEGKRLDNHFSKGTRRENQQGGKTQS